ncbi:hypothetical protein CYANOKiyG1_22620 [Okeania sp. KiyG1]|nr:hypothetical protein CYANOKiyG1_22620 [Okeania sp. KiyG1]
MSEPNNSDQNKTSSHWAVSEEDCENMAERNQWKLLETRKDDIDILPGLKAREFLLSHSSSAG